jgi:hypothetical protein
MPQNKINHTINKPPIMDNEILNSICKLAKLAGSDEEIEAVKKCLYMFKMANKKNPDLMRICDNAESIIYKRSLDIKVYYSSSNSQW